MKMVQNKKRFLSSLRPEHGFTLVELSISLLAMSFIALGFLAYFKAQEQNLMVERQKEKIKTIEAALTSYARKFGRYPCPADRGVVIGYGGETIAGQWGYGGYGRGQDCSNPGLPLGNNVRVPGATPGTWVRIGMVPFLDLELPASAAYDVYGNRFTYAVTESLADNAKLHPAAGPQDTHLDPIPDLNFRQGEINVITMNGGTTITDRAHFVIISHGEFGEGAFQSTDADGDDIVERIPCDSGNFNESANCDDTDSLFIAGNFATIENGFQRFNDYVSYSISECDPSSSARSGDSCATGSSGQNVYVKPTGNFGVGYGWESYLYDGIPGWDNDLIEDFALHAKMDVDGEVRISNVDQPCTPAIDGTIRYRRTERSSPDPNLRPVDDLTYLAASPHDGPNSPLSVVEFCAGDEFTWHRLGRERPCEGYTNISDPVNTITNFIAALGGQINGDQENALDTIAHDAKVNIVQTAYPTITGITTGTFVAPIPGLGFIMDDDFFDGFILAALFGGPGTEGVVPPTPLAATTFQPFRILPSMEHMETRVIKDTYCVVGGTLFGIPQFGGELNLGATLIEEKFLYQCINGEIKLQSRVRSLILGGDPGSPLGSCPVLN